MNIRPFVATLLVILMAASPIPAGAGEAPQYGGRLTVLSAFPGIDPMNWDQADWSWKHADDTGLVIEHLLAGDLQKGPRGTNAHPFTANSWLPSEFVRGELAERWEVQTEPLALVFHLRRGVYWQEKPGVMARREFTAEDAVYSFNRLAAARRAIPGFLGFIERWEVRDKFTAVAYLRRWCADWAYRIGWGYFDGVQAPEQEKAGPRDWRNLCGTGPFMLTDYKTGHSLTFVKNGDYWDSEPVDGKPYKLPFTDTLVSMFMKDPQAQLTAMRTGKVDLMMVVTKQGMESLKKDAPQIQFAKRPLGIGYMLAFRMDQKPFDDIRVRRALNLAVNQQEIIDTLYEGDGILNNYPFPPYFKEVYTPLAQMPESVRELFTYNPEKAKKLLAEAGYPNGFTFKAQVSSNSNMDIESLVVAYLAKVGVTLELEPVPYSAMMGLMFSKRHGPGYFFANDHGNPFAAIARNFVSGSPWNVYMLSNETIDATYQKTIADINLSQAEAFARMKAMAVLAMDQAPAVFLPGTHVYSAWWPWVKNYYGEIRSGAHRPGPILARVWIDQALKQKMGY